ncbi:MAG: T9SS type A sorting domain-containing protein, partial [bacterium]
TYPSIGPIASGQFQPDIGGARAFVQDPGNATFKYFFKADTLYVGVDVRDKAVWSNPTPEALWDGIRFTIVDRATRDPVENRLLGRSIFVRFDPAGNAVAEEDLKTLNLLNKGVKAGVKIKPNTTINDFNDIDQGFFVELAIDLTKFGYPAGRGDGVAFIGAALYDYDGFPNAADNYGNWAWWFKERANSASPAWALMNPALIVGVDEEANAGIPDRFALLGNYPNPFNPSTTILYTVPEPGVVTLKVFDVLGRRVRTLLLGSQEPGKRETVFTPTNLSSGVYFYRLEMTSARTRKISSTQVGKLLLMK